MDTCVRPPPVVFNLMMLPPELRIKIYEFALVRGVIRIVNTAHPFRALASSRNKSLKAFYEEINLEKPESLRSRRTHFESVKNTAGEEMGEDISFSYAIKPSESPPLVNIFLTSCQVYSEAWPIFYQRNAFAFTTPQKCLTSICKCLRFLYDRPYHALQHIYELHINIGEAPNQPFRRILAGCGWQIFLDELKRYMSLRVLVLYIRGRTDDAPEYRFSGWPWREWLYSIAELRPLRELRLDIVNESTHEQNIAFAKQMRSKMMVGSEQMGTEGFTVGRRQSPYPWGVSNTLTISSNIPDMEENYQTFNPS